MAEITVKEFEERIFGLGGKRISLHTYFKKCWYHPREFSNRYKLYEKKIKEEDAWISTEGYISKDQKISIYCFTGESVNKTRTQLVSFIKNKYKKGLGYSILYPSIFVGSRDGIFITSMFDQGSFNPIFNKIWKETFDIFRFHKVKPSS